MLRDPFASGGMIIHNFRTTHPIRAATSFPVSVSGDLFPLSLLCQSDDPLLSDLFRRDSTPFWMSSVLSLHPIPATVMATPKSAWRMLSAALVITLFLLTVSCDPRADVFQPSDELRFSLFGTLDVAADTQVIRVTSLRDSIQLGAQSQLNASVILENLDTGARSTLQDSFASAGVEMVHNFWTTHPIRAATSYRVSVRRADEVITSATTKTPGHPPELIQKGSMTLSCGNDTLKNSVTIGVKNAEHLAGVKAIYFPRNESVPSTFNHFQGVERRNDGFSIRIFYSPDLEAINGKQPGEKLPSCADPIDLSRKYTDVVVWAGGPNWPEWMNAHINEVGRPNSFSNVRGGHGYVGGIYPDTIRVPISISDDELP